MSGSSVSGSSVSVDGRRLLERIARFAEIGRNSEGGIDRVAFSDADNEARAALLAEATIAGLTGSVDAAGNVLLRRAAPTVGTRPDRPVLLIGSHLDTVVNGGRLDGAYGVLAALEVLQVVVETGAQPAHEPVVVAFANEEGARFPQPFWGSKALAGLLDEPSVDPVDHHGTSLREPLARAGGDLDRLAGSAWAPGAVAAYVELHIEQGPVLEAAGDRIGVVSAIAGRCVLTVVVRGAAGHAGTTPMALRRDPVAGAARIVGEVEALATAGGQCRLATVGRFEVRPNSPNTIAETVSLTVDLRDDDPDVLAGAERAVCAVADTVAQERGLDVAVSVSTRSGPVHADPVLMAAIADSATELGLPHQVLPSGAAHDAQIMANLAPIGMIFVPSIGGLSHVPQEDTAPDDLVAGAQVLLRTAFRIT